MLHRLPAELRLIILENCDLLSLIHLRQVSTYYKCLAEEELRTRKRLDVNADYLTVFSDHLSSSVDTHHEIYMEKLIDFLGAYMPQLCELSLRYCPVLLTLSSLIKLAKVCQQLIALDLSQLYGKPNFEKDAVLALPFFHNLKVLKLDGFESRKSAGRGCAHRIEIPPIRQLRKLEVFEMQCKSDSLFRILCSMHETQTILPHLKRVNLGVKHCAAAYPELLIWFLRTHRSLECVHIYNALFATSDQLRRFYNALMLLPFLVELNLSTCTSCDRVDHTMQAQFSKAMQAKGIRQEGIVRSLRFDPDSNH